MTLQAFNAGCNIVGIRKQGKNHGMCCAWAQMIDYDRLTMLLGSQSVTGKVIQVNDMVGISALSKDQKDIAIKMGDGHSDQQDKFFGIPHHFEDSAILVEGAKVLMKCLVMDIQHPPGNDRDQFLFLKVLSYDQKDELKFLCAEDV